MGPVRVGNQAQEHFQHDVYGNIILGAAQAFHDHRLFRRAGKARVRRSSKRVGEQAFRIYDKPDAGMWELRTRARIHTSSALMCWAACDRLAKIARALRLTDRAAYWRERADEIRDRILRESWSEERQAFAESFGGERPRRQRAADGRGQLHRAERPALRRDRGRAGEASLCDGPYMRRYEAADDFGKPEMAFNVCTFWRIDALARIGRKEQAREIFEVMLRTRNPSACCRKTRTRASAKWGNFPQTYSMVGIINAAVRLSRRWDTVV